MALNRFRFPKTSRLHLRKEINELITTGKTIHVTPLKGFYKILPAGESPLKMTVAVPKRNFKLAVDRNRIKRQIREAYRLNSQAAANFFKEQNSTVHLLLVYTNRVSPEYVGLESKIILILQRLQERHESSAG